MFAKTQATGNKATSLAPPGMTLHHLSQIINLRFHLLVPYGAAVTAVFPVTGYKYYPLFQNRNHLNNFQSPSLYFKQRTIEDTFADHLQS